jgi:hypothetical protein
MEPSPVHHPFACMLNQYGGAATLEAMGCKDLTDRRVCAYSERLLLLARLIAD